MNLKDNIGDMTSKKRKYDNEGNGNGNAQIGFLNETKNLADKC